MIRPAAFAATGALPSAAAARRAVRGRPGADEEERLRAALRSTARVSAVLFGASLPVRHREARHALRLAFAGSHTVHATLIARYLPRKSGGLPLPLELGGGGLGYLCLARLVAAEGRPGPAESAAEAYLAAVFIGDLAYGFARKGRDGRVNGPLVLGLVVAAALGRRARSRAGAYPLRASNSIEQPS